MPFLARLQGILLDPKREWPRIAAEPATLPGLYSGWIMVLAAIGPLVLLAGSGIAVRVAVLFYVNALVGAAVIALVIDLIAPSFGGTKDYVAALKLTAYSSTAMWVAQITLLVPAAGALVVLAATIYTLYTLFLGAPVLGKCAPDKALAFTVVVLLCAMVLGYLISRIVFGPMAGMGMTGARSGL